EQSHRHAPPALHVGRRSGASARRAVGGRRPPTVHDLETVQHALHLRTRPQARPWRDRQRIRPRPDARLGVGPRLPAAAAARLALCAAGAAGVARCAQHHTSGRYLAALTNDARFDGVGGEYFDGLRPIRSSADSYDRDKALDLWSTSERLLTHATK